MINGPQAMNDEEMMLRAMAIAEAAVNDMAELGAGPAHRAIALAWHMQRQAEIAMPNNEAAAEFKLSLAVT